MKCKRCPAEARPNRKFCQRCADIRSAEHMKWKRANRDKILQSTRERFRRLRNDVLTKYGGKCVCCSETFRPYLELDHINGGGNQDRKNYGRHYLNLLESLRPDIQILCANCHAAKTYGVSCPPHSSLSSSVHGD